jgi:DnaK suppressor protein
MNAAEQSVFFDRLTADLAHQVESIAEVLASTGTVMPESQGEAPLSRMDAMQLQAIAQDQLERFNLRRRKVEAALARVSAGAYGLCCECHANIAVDRLEADPAEVFCQECAEEREAP